MSLVTNCNTQITDQVPADPIILFPNEIFLMIFDFLEGDAARMACLLVNKIWHTFAQGELNRSVEKNVEEYVNRFSQIFVKFKINPLEDALFAVYISHVAKITSLNLSKDCQQKGIKRENYLTESGIFGVVNRSRFKIESSKYNQSDYIDSYAILKEAIDECIKTACLNCICAAQRELGGYETEGVGSATSGKVIIKVDGVSQEVEGEVLNESDVFVFGKKEIHLRLLASLERELETLNRSICRSDLSEHITSSISSERCALIEKIDAMKAACVKNSEDLKKLEKENNKILAELNLAPSAKRTSECLKNAKKELEQIEKRLNTLFALEMNRSGCEICLINEAEEEWIVI
jgi:hypothetical protein